MYPQIAQPQYYANGQFNSPYYVPQTLPPQTGPYLPNAYVQ